jgi:hypothetical protein
MLPAHINQTNTTLKGGERKDINDKIPSTVQTKKGGAKPYHGNSSLTY